MKFYAYKPDRKGSEPTGGRNRILFELKTYTGAIRRATRILGNKAKVFTYHSFYSGDFTQIY